MLHVIIVVKLHSKLTDPTQFHLVGVGIDLVMMMMVVVEMEMEMELVVVVVWWCAMVIRVSNIREDITAE